MEKEAFDALVRELEETARRSPGAYRVRVGAFALLGYVVYGAIIVVALGLLVGIGALLIWHPSAWILKLGWKLGIPLFLLIVALFGALKISIPPPQGLALTRADAPELFRLIDDLSRRLKVPGLERVLATSEYNASVMQVPRYGLFGSRNYLLLGVPLMQALSKEDLTAVIAHEFGHLSGNHSRFAGWVYRSVRSYVQVLQRLGGNKLLEKFLGWYVPRLDALSFPLRRKNEYDADAASAEIVGRERAGQALVNIHVRAALEEGFWKDVKKQVLDTPHPPAQLFRVWGERVLTHGEDDAKSALAAALREETGTSDTHPSLKDRLAALSFEPRLEVPPPETAARALLGDRCDYFVEQAGYLWSSEVHEGWKAQHERFREARERLAALEAERQHRGLTADEAFEYADLSEDVLVDEDPMPRYRVVLELDPEHARAQFAVARILLDRGNSEGVPMMERLQEARPLDLRLGANAVLSRYYERSGDSASAKASFERAQAAFEEQQGIERQREELRATDRFVPHGLGAEALSTLRADLEHFPVKRAYLVRKVVGDEDRRFVVGIELTYKERLLKKGGEVAKNVANSVTLPGEIWVIPLEDNDSFRVPLQKVEGALVFTRS